ncbi:MAG: transcriptional regulator [Fervidicoccaceae archaeon]|jgi:predicted transcriptional regulator
MRKISGTKVMSYMCDNKKVALIQASIRSCLAEILTEKGLSAKKISELLGTSRAAVSYYKRGERGNILKKRLMENERYRTMLLEIADLIIDDNGTGVLSPIIEEKICRLCRELRAKYISIDSS